MHQMLVALTPLFDCPVRESGGCIELSCDATGKDNVHIRLQLYDGSDGGHWRRAVMPLAVVRRDPALRSAAELHARNLAHYNVLSRQPALFSSSSFFTHGDIMWMGRAWPDVPRAAWTDAVDAMRRTTSLYDLCARSISVHNAHLCADEDTSPHLF